MAGTNAFGAVCTERRWKSFDPAGSEAEVAGHVREEGAVRLRHTRSRRTIEQHAWPSERPASHRNQAVLSYAVAGTGPLPTHLLHPTYSEKAFIPMVPPSCYVLEP
eukprot:858829-Rhodomonas_salina.1